MRVFFTDECQQIVNSATGVRARSAELLFVYIDVESVAFNRGFFSVDVQFFYKITVDIFVNSTRAINVCGMATYSKRVLLFGSEGGAKIFSSNTILGEADCPQVQKANLPTAYVEALDPILLDVRLVDVAGSSSGCGCNCCCGCCDCDLNGIPSVVSGCFEDVLSATNETKRVLVTLGQFSIIRLERDTQLLIPSYDYCIPNKDCTVISGTESSSPCDIFASLSFPTDQFFPPAECDINDCTSNGSVGGTSTGSCGCGTVSGSTTGNTCCTCR